MAEQLLNNAQISPPIEQVRCEGMAQGMDTNWLRDARLLRLRADRSPQGRSLPGLSLPVKKS